MLFLAVFVALFACFQRIHERRWSMNVELFLAAKERHFCSLFLCYLVCPFISYLLSLAMIFILIFGTFGEKLAPSQPFALKTWIAAILTLTLCSSASFSSFLIISRKARLYLIGRNYFFQALEKARLEEHTTPGGRIDDTLVIEPGGFSILNSFSRDFNEPGYETPTVWETLRPAEEETKTQLQGKQSLVDPLLEKGGVSRRTGLRSS